MNPSKRTKEVNTSSLKLPKVKLRLSNRNIPQRIKNSRGQEMSDHLSRRKRIRNFRSKTTKTSKILQKLELNTILGDSPMKSAFFGRKKNSSPLKIRRRKRLKNHYSKSFDFSKKSPSFLLHETKRKKDLKIQTRFLKYKFTNSGKLYDSRIAKERRVMIGEIKEKNGHFMKMKLSELTKLKLDDTDSSSIDKNSGKSEKVQNFFMKKKAKKSKNSKNKRRKIKVLDTRDMSKITSFNFRNGSEEDLIKEGKKSDTLFFMDEINLSKKNSEKSKSKSKINFPFSIGISTNMNPNFRILPTQSEKMDKKRLKVYVSQKGKGADNFSIAYEDIKKAAKSSSKPLKYTTNEKVFKEEMQLDDIEGEIDHGKDSFTVMKLKLFKLVKQDLSSLYRDLLLNAKSEEELIPDSEFFF